MREYRIAKHWAIFVYITAPLMILVFAGLLISPFVPLLGDGMSKEAYWFLAPLSVIMIGLMVVGLLDAIKGKFVIAEGEIYSIGTLSTRQLVFNEIKGYRVNDQYIVIESNVSNKKKIKVSRYFANTSEIIHWLSSSYSNLDNLNVEQEKQDILDNQELGATTEERAERLTNARKTAKILNGAGLLAGAWTLFFPRPYEFAIIASILIPIAVIALLRQAKALIRIDERKDSAYPSVFAAICFPSIALLLRAMFDYNIFTNENVWMPAIVISGIIIASITTSNDEFSFKNKRSYFSIFFVFLIFLAYTYGSIITINCTFDNSQPQIFRSTILDKRISTGKTTTYYFKLTPWGQRKEIEDVTVSEDLYNQFDREAEVNVIFKNGKFNIPWFIVTE